MNSVASLATNSAMFIRRDPTFSSTPSAERQLREIMRARAMRSEFFDPALFADPAWDILLELYDAELAGHRTTVAACCAAANVPVTTALRRIATLSTRGLVLRRPDPLDGRRIFLSLSREASTAMSHFFDARAKLRAREQT